MMESGTVARISHWSSIFTLSVFILTNFTTVPLFAVLLLLATKCIDGHDLRRGIVGEGGVKPLSIMALFISLAYLTISLDTAGLFRFLAFWVANKGGSSGRRLHLYFWVFFLLLAVAVGNDPVVLSGTPFLAYFTRIAGISPPPTAWIYMQFCAANMGSAVLVSSNLTNLVLAGAFSISFTTFTAFMALPFLAAAIATYPVFLLMFRGRDYIPRSIDVQGEGSAIGPSSVLVDRWGAIFGSVLLTATLGVLVGTSILHVPVWQITVPPAVITFIRDVVYDWYMSGSAAQPESIEMEQTTVTSQMSATAGVPPRVSQNVRGFWSHLTPSYLASRFPTATTVLKRLPVTLVPFALLTFVLVQGLTRKGWVELFANGWAWWARNTGVVGVTAGMGIIACILCNICGTNIGATIFAARVLEVWIARMGNTLDPKQRDAAIYSLAIASNYGAFTFTICASLAGLLWRDILKQKGINVRQWQFCKLNLPLVIVSMVASSAVLIGEMYVVHKN
ncbi:hypothetical protein BDM02DRAFT_3156650 [Thelephora ganbajun]|uniref:Uncharacterized protein n=1 Tax=Thelephora ganbajun TaxID=370292 RepID=A0ACB6Z9M2_THEGA|nr:hypothetical protein BDM02DRAFT_3156650 [Thelephora ganbajun]